MLEENQSVLNTIRICDRFTLLDYYKAPSEHNTQLGKTWLDKPHRLLYDLIKYCLYKNTKEKVYALNNDGSILGIFSSPTEAQAAFKYALTTGSVKEHKMHIVELTLNKMEIV